MDGPTSLTLVFLILSYGCLSNQMMPDDVRSTTGHTTRPSDTPDAIIACTNSRGAAGGCVERFYCNYNTSHIDLTVYGPPGYRDPCQGKGVCCPTEYILPATPAKSSDNNDVDFGDYD